MFVTSCVIAGLITGILDAIIVRKTKNFITTFFTMIIDALLSNIAGLGLSAFLFKCFTNTTLFPIESHSVKFQYIHFIIILACGFMLVLFAGILDGIFIFKHEDESKKNRIALKITCVVLAAIGIAAFTGTVWGKEVFGNISPDQMMVNLFSPKEGTSDDIMGTLWTGPVLQTVSATLIFSLFVFSRRELYYIRKGTEKKVFPSLARKIVCFVLALAVFIGGLTYGFIKFEFEKLLKMYVIESDFIEYNFVDPREVSMQFPEKKRNLIHIYLESMENSYASKDMGGYMEENLIKPLTDLAEEGYSFSNNPTGLGGPVATTGCTWSVASMVNMNGGIPMKVTTGGNLYGSADNFMPGAITIGDILESQGYEQSLMFGASARFGGLNFFYESHGDFTILDYNAAKEKGWIPKDYKVWWGYEDDKLYEYAKAELTRLHETGKPFNFVMETADTHFPDGYVGPNTPTPRDNQYANVIAYSASETEKFVRWIQEQPFYENTTIILIGDHLSMDTKFFENFDKEYLRTTFNLILNPDPSIGKIPTEKLQNRWWCNIDMFPTILASIGVKIEGDRLALGTNLFSDVPTLFEENGGRKGWEKINRKFEYKSDFYNSTILEGNNAPFDTKKVTEY